MRNKVWRPAGLFVRTFLSLATRDLGFTREQVLLARIDARRAVVNSAQRIPTYERVRRAVQAVPGVADAALSVITPMSNLVFDPSIGVSGTRIVSPHMYGNVISPGWFEAYGIPIVSGRTILETDVSTRSLSSWSTRPSCDAISPGRLRLASF